MSVELLIASMLSLMLAISISFFLNMVCLDNESVTKRSGPGLYIMLISYWCILSIMCCIHCDSIFICFLLYSSE